MGKLITVNFGGKPAMVTTEQIKLTPKQAYNKAMSEQSRTINDERRAVYKKLRETAWFIANIKDQYTLLSDSRYRTTKQRRIKQPNDQYTKDLVNEFDRLTLASKRLWKQWKRGEV